MDCFSIENEVPKKKKTKYQIKDLACKGFCTLGMN